MSREPLAIRRVMCPGCPFRAGSKVDPRHLERARRRQIVDDLEAGLSFVCHMEAHGDLPGGGAGPRMCTGAATLLARVGKPNAVMQIAVRLGEPPFVDQGELMPWGSLAEWVDC